MLQQTQVKTVIPYYLKFMQDFPDLNSLALATQDEVLHLWTGLGYYARARNLHKTAQIIQVEHQAKFPQSHEILQSLPGIGRSTAGAILSFANAQHQPILDGNVKRILSRHFRVQGWSGHSKTLKQLWLLAEQITPEKRCADFNQAMMDLGATLCSRSKPQCQQCPLEKSCEAFQQQEIAQYPEPKPKKEIPIKSTYLLILSDKNNDILLEKRPEQGIWGGLWSFPQCKTKSEINHWLEKHQYELKQKMLFYPQFRHTFSHYHLQITPVRISINTPEKIMDNTDFLWYCLKKPLKLGMPTPIKKLLSQLYNNLNGTKE